MGAELRVPLQRTPVDHEELRAALTDGWRGLYAEEPPTDSISILLAQSALETAHWARCMNWNLGGIKAGEDVSHTYYTTLERLPRARAEQELTGSTPLAPCELVADDGGALVTLRFFPSHPMCRFRAFANLGESTGEYLGLLARRYAGAVDKARDGDITGFVSALHQHDYFTASVAAYQADIEVLFDEYVEPCLSSSAEIRASLASLGFDDVKAFQRAVGLSVDGIVGSKTRAAIRARLGEVSLE